MTPEERQQFQKMLSQVGELYAWMQGKKVQQITAPLDEASRHSLGAGLYSADGSSTLTQTITIGAGGGSASVPKAYLGSIVVEFHGVRYEMPYISLP